MCERIHRQGLLARRERRLWRFGFGAVVGERCQAVEEVFNLRGDVLQRSLGGIRGVDTVVDAEQAVVAVQNRRQRPGVLPRRFVELDQGGRRIVGNMESHRLPLVHGNPEGEMVRDDVVVGAICVEHCPPEWRREELVHALEGGDGEWQRLVDDALARLVAVPLVEQVVHVVERGHVGLRRLDGLAHPVEAPRVLEGDARQLSRGRGRRREEVTWCHGVAEHHVIVQVDEVLRQPGDPMQVGLDGVRAERDLALSEHAGREDIVVLDKFHFCDQPYWQLAEPLGPLGLTANNDEDVADPRGVTAHSE
mmetsp:Transcript_24181/g.60036  ORF Transcript_24181/g.60036 Transcript_24181/m.60036 type:complete len:307 (+) Transcript_24181:958-1878(+)